MSNFGHYHNVKSHVCCYTTSSRQKRILPFQRITQVSGQGCAQKKVVPVRKLCKLSVVPLLISNYSSVYLSMYLFILSIYLTILLVVGVSYQRVPCLAESYSQTWEAHFKWENFYLIGGNRVNNQRKKSLTIGVGQQPIQLLTLTSKIQKTFPVVLNKTKEKYQKILASSGQVAVLTTARSNIIYFLKLKTHFQWEHFCHI